MRQKHGLVTEKMTDGLMIVPTEGEDIGRMLSIADGSGCFVWNLLENDVTFDEIADALTKEYGISHKTAECDLKEFLDTIKDYIVI